MPSLLVRGSALAAALIIAGTTAGCGGGDSDSSAEKPASISKAEFVARANAICSKGEKKQETEFDAYVRKHNLEERRPTDAQQAEMVEDIFAPNVQGQIDAVSALGAPKGEEQQVSSALQISQETLDRVKADPGLFFGNEDLFAAAGKQLHALGLVQCAPES
jgi:hypothetical protein